MVGTEKVEVPKLVGADAEGARQQIQSIKRIVEESLRMTHAVREEAARADQLRADKKVNIRQQVTHFDIREGQMVSYDGHEYTVQELATGHSRVC